MTGKTINHRVFNHSPDRLHCILPPYLLEKLAESPDRKVRRAALQSIEASSEARTRRLMISLYPALAAASRREARKHRQIYDLGGRSPALLPGKLVRSEGEPRVEDRAVNEAYTGTGHVHDFYRRLFGRNSLDNRGMSLVSTVHVGKQYNNAFWNGEQMAFGDGDGIVFRRFTRSLDVIAHELTHGVITHTSNLDYYGQPGALNEHFADVFGILVQQWRRKKSAAKADWVIGRRIMGPKVRAEGLRTFLKNKAFEEDPYLGTDPQPKHMDGLYRGSADRGGVHINSGIPNHAFYLAARKLGGAAWERAGRIWYLSMLRLGRRAGFRSAAGETLRAAAALYPRSRKTRRIVREAWKAVGVEAD